MHVWVLTYESTDTDVFRHSVFTHGLDALSMFDTYVNETMTELEDWHEVTIDLTSYADAVLYDFCYIPYDNATQIPSLHIRANDAFDRINIWLRKEPVRT